MTVTKAHSAKLMEFTVSQIAGMLNGKVEGDGSARIHALKTIQEGVKGSISFLSNPKYEPFIYETKASAVIVDKDFKPRKAVDPSLIRVDDPYVSFSILLEEYHKFISFKKVGVEEPAYISSGVRIGKACYRGAFSYIGENAIIGNNVKIYPQVYVGDNVLIGDNTIIHSGVKIYSDSEIGSNCVVSSGVIIGSDGFGFVPQKDGSYKTIPQLGNVVIGDFVHIGANATIDCATLQGDHTVISSGVKLDNLVQVAHNVKIGEHTVIAAQSGIAGSSTIGKYCVMGGQVGIIGHVHIKDRTQIGAKAGVSKSRKEGEKLTGSPAFDVKEYYNSYAVFKKLPDLKYRLEELEKKLLTLQAV